MPLSISPGLGELLKENAFAVVCVDGVLVGGDDVIEITAPSSPTSVTISVVLSQCN